MDGEYVIKVRLWRNTFDLMRGMEDPHEIEIAVDKQRVRTDYRGRAAGLRSRWRRTPVISARTSISA